MRWSAHEYLCNYYNRTMKQNKARTIVTIIGVILATAMISAVITLGISFRDICMIMR